MSELTDHARKLCETVKVMSLATVDAHGLPYAANVYFAADEALTLYFVSARDSAHSQHIARSPRVAATIYPEVSDYLDIRGVQLRGEVTAVPEDQWEQAWTVYLGRFPFVAKLAEMVRAQQMYRLRPTWMRYIDNGIRFGYRVEQTMEPGEAENQPQRPRGNG